MDSAPLVPANVPIIRELQPLPADVRAGKIVCVGFADILALVSGKTIRINVGAVVQSV